MFYLLRLTVLGLMTSLFASLALAASDDASSESEAERPAISGDPEKPRRHFRIRNAVELNAEEANEFYGALRAQMAAGYAASGTATGRSYQDWLPANNAPYESATHGKRYVSNYVNDLANDYLRYEKSGILPQGAIVAKDSFTLTDEGELLVGPLFIMEKMEAGFNYVSGDWRYSMIMPDGEFFGMTKGPGAEKVEYCIGCHLMRGDSDHLFWVPSDYRVQ